jgi:hypothetical protein
MNRNVYSFAIVGLLTLLVGCYPSTGPEYYEETDIAYTNYDRNFAFASKSTYSLPDKVVKITGKPDQPPEYVKDIYGIPILAQIDADMQSLGWTKVDITNNPHVQLLPASWSSTTIIYGGYWGNYWCWYYPYYCGGGWYYPYVPVATYSTGTLVTTMVDPNQESADGSKKVVWTGAINGMLSGTSDITRIKNGIDQTFMQSPYLKRN